MGSYRLVKMLNPISITVNGTFTPKGAYNGATSYSVGDQVDYNGTSYILYSAASAGTLPTDNTKWGVLASKGDKGDKGDTGATGLKGDKGDTGLTGAAGTNGQGVPTGGTTGQQLAKINGTDYNTQWVNPVDISGKADTSALTAHTSNTSNPHSVTKAQVGLGSVPDTDFTSAIAAKQDTLVSGTNIKTINSTSILGSGDIVIGGAVDSVNTQTGAVVLDTDDIAEGTNKYVTSAEKTILSNTSGVNTGDQVVPAQFNPIAGSNVTLTGTYPNVTFNSSGGGTWGSITGTLSSQTDLNSALDGKFDKTGGTITQTGSDSGYIDIRSGPTGNRSSFSLTGNGSPNAGDTMTFQMRNDIGDVIAFVYDTSASTYHNFLRFDYLNDKVSFPHMLPFSNLTYDLGSSSAYFANTYTQKLYLNSTAYIDGSTAGQLIFTGLPKASEFEFTTSTNNGLHTSATSGILRLSGGTLNDGAVILMGGSTNGVIQSKGVARVGTTDIFSWNTTGVGIAGGIGGHAPTHSLTLASTTTGIALYNTTDQTTNYERVRQYWSGNAFYIRGELGGTGVARDLIFGTANRNVLMTLKDTASSTLGNISFSTGGGGAGLTALSVTGTWTSASGVNSHVTVNPTINQSGTAGYTALLINPTETTTGSGAKNLIDAQVGGSTRFKVDNSGAVQTTSPSSTSNSMYINTGAGGNRASINLRGYNASNSGDYFTTEMRTDTTELVMYVYDASITTYSTFLTFSYLSGVVTFGQNLTVADAKNISLGSTTGTKIGTATTQKLGFYNATPVVRPSGDIGTALSNLGLVASPVITTATDVEITDTTKGVILKAPGGGRWRLTIDNSGNIVTTSI